MSNSENTQTIHLINGEEYVLLRDEARNKRVTPQDLLKFLAEQFNISCYRKVKGEYVYVYVWGISKLPFDLRNSLLIPRTATQIVPRTPRSEVHYAFYEYYFARAEWMSSIDQMRAAPRYKSTKSPEYLTYLKASGRRHHADNDLQQAEAVLDFVLRQFTGDGEFLRLSRLFFAATVAHTNGQKAAETAAFNASYYGMEYPEDREYYETLSNQAWTVEMKAYEHLLAVTREYGNFLVKLRISELKIFGEVLLAESAHRDAKKALDQVNWSDDAAFNREEEKVERAERMEATTRKEFLAWWSPSILPERLAAHQQRMESINKEAESYFASRNNDID
jgi:hypothetical protein